jgi:hypothetical protein
LQKDKKVGCFERFKALFWQRFEDRPFLKLLSTGIRSPIPIYFENIMHYGIEFPLNTNLSSASERKSVEPQGVANIGEHRLHGSHAPAVNKTPYC